jgi:hypothetical protein
VADSLVIVLLTVPKEAREDALRTLQGDAIDGYPGAVTGAAASYVESETAERQDSEVISVAARVPAAPNPHLAEELWRAVEATLFRGGISAVETMAGYAIPAP